MAKNPKHRRTAGSIDEIKSIISVKVLGEIKKNQMAIDVSRIFRVKISRPKKRFESQVVINMVIQSAKTKRPMRRTLICVLTNCRDNFITVIGANRSGPRNIMIIVPIAIHIIDNLFITLSDQLKSCKVLL